MSLENYEVIRFRYGMKVLTIEQMMGFVERKIITKKQFHEITSYSYDGLKELKEKGDYLK